MAIQTEFIETVNGDLIRAATIDSLSPNDAQQEYTARTNDGRVHYLKPDVVALLTGKKRMVKK